ncbi:restriction endonuclease subunit S [Caldilinea sp.]|uniref:restriction endonuclease subunit S n=1 Tax=Caldilinea sp. TaxID=2293560 RepID=UPI002BD13FF5|nr:restriction endonuclease subunit S [Caldilinea sp.]
MSVRELTLDQLGEVSRGRSRHRPRDAAHLYGGPFPFIQTGDVKKANLYLTEFEKTYSEAGLAQSKLWPAGTLCITIAANIADTAILGIDACFPDSVIGFTGQPETTDTRFVKYLFDGVLKVKYRAFTQGAAQENLSQEKLLSIRFPVPELRVQRRIADILSTFDDLIENNRRRIGLLEQAARMLYREWFIQLRFPGHEHVKITNGVPEGWERRDFGKVAQLNYGKALKAEHRIEGPFPVYGSSGQVGTHDKALVEAPAIVVGRKGNVGSVFWSPENFWPIDTAYFISKQQSDYWLYQTLPNIGFQNTDSGVPGLNRDFAYSRKVTVPTDQLRREYNLSVEPMLGQAQLLASYNQKLAQARDLLLPRLMNGEIAV